MHDSDASVSSPAVAGSLEIERAREELVAVLAALHHGRGPHDGPSVRGALERYVDAARASGRTAEAVVIGVKAACVRAHLMPESVLLGYQYARGDWGALVSRLVSLGIERYYLGSPYR